MGHATAVSLSSTVPVNAIGTSKVIASRTTLPILLAGRTADAQLVTLLHSPLGAYVAETEALRDKKIRVVLDIAPDDLNFALHALMTTLPEATIGALGGPIRARMH